MFETEELDKLSRVLEEMTQPESPPKQLKIFAFLMWFFLIAFLIHAFVFLWLAREQPYLKDTEFQDYLSFVYNSYVGFVACFELIIIIALIYIIWHRKQFSPYIVISLERILCRDAKFIKRLWEFDKATLAYGLLQYRHRWSSEGVALLVGNLRNLGVFPALAALVIPTATWFKESSNPILWALVVVVAIFYLMAFVALFSRQRPQQVIQLLEYAIHYADQGNANPSEANTSAPSV